MGVHRERGIGEPLCVCTLKEPCDGCGCRDPAKHFRGTSVSPRRKQPEWECTRASSSSLQSLLSEFGGWGALPFGEPLGVGLGQALPGTPGGL